MTDLTIDQLVEESYRIACEHGWWDEEPERSFGDLIALMHSELSEALEAYRDDEQPMWAHLEGDGREKPEGMLAELADVLIRIGDLCGHYGWDLEAAVRVKLDFNEGRPFRHGGKKL